MSNFIEFHWKVFFIELFNSSNGLFHLMGQIVKSVILSNESFHRNSLKILFNKYLNLSIGSFHLMGQFIKRILKPNGSFHRISLERLFHRFGHFSEWVMEENIFNQIGHFAEQWISFSCCQKQLSVKWLTTPSRAARLPDSSTLLSFI